MESWKARRETVKREREERAALPRPPEPPPPLWSTTPVNPESILVRPAEPGQPRTGLVDSGIDCVITQAQRRQVRLEVADRVAGIMGYQGDWGAQFDAQADWWPITSWPVVMRRLYYVPHKTYPERFTMFLFLNQNGMHPLHAAGWTLTPGFASYDEAAWNHVFGLARASCEGKLHGRYNTMAMT